MDTNEFLESLEEGERMIKEFRKFKNSFYEEMKTSMLDLVFKIFPMAKTDEAYCERLEKQTNTICMMSFDAGQLAMERDDDNMEYKHASLLPKKPSEEKQQESIDSLKKIVANAGYDYPPEMDDESWDEFHLDVQLYNLAMNIHKEVLRIFTKYYDEEVLNFSGDTLRFLNNRIYIHCTSSLHELLLELVDKHRDHFRETYV